MKLYSDLRCTTLNVTRDVKFPGILNYWENRGKTTKKWEKINILFPGVKNLILPISRIEGCNTLKNRHFYYKGGSKLVRTFLTQNTYISERSNSF
jgi:hypothetical protein